jgi:tetratricopeptide (TPR) repeat protein
MRALRTAARFLAAVLAVAPSWHAAQEQPARARPASLPALALDGLPAAVRSTLARIDAEARAKPDDPAAVGRLAMVLHAYEQPALALQCYTRARQLDPGSFRWAYLGGVSAAEAGEHAQAASLLRSAIAMTPEYLPARVKLADVLYAQRDFTAGREEYRRLTAEFPELAVAHFGLGRTAAALGDEQAAAAHYERAIAASPEFGRAHYALALLHRNAGRLEKARVHLDAYGTLGSRQPAVDDPLVAEVLAMRSTARDLIAEGARLGTEGRLAESIDVHLKALEADPQAAQAHVNLISLYGRMGRSEEADAHYRKALALDSHVAGAHYNYGVLLASAGRREEAMDLFRKAVAVDPFHARAHHNLAALLAGQKRLQEAASHFRQALASEPQHRGARFGLAQVLLSLGQPGEAIAQLEKIVSPEHPDTPRYKHVLARAWMAHGDPARAQAVAREALEAARRTGQAELAAAIERDLQRMGPGRR